MQTAVYHWRATRRLPVSDNSASEITPPSGLPMMTAANGRLANRPESRIETPRISRRNVGYQLA